MFNNYNDVLLILVNFTSCLNNRFVSGMFLLHEHYICFTYFMHSLVMFIPIYCMCM